MEIDQWECKLVKQIACVRSGKIYNAMISYLFVTGMAGSLTRQKSASFTDSGTVSTHPSRGIRMF